jgi:hypothetical protein
MRYQPKYSRQKNGEVLMTSPFPATLTVEGLDVGDHQTDNTDDTDNARKRSNFKLHWKTPPKKYEMYV